MPALPRPLVEESLSSRYLPEGTYDATCIRVHDEPNWMRDHWYIVLIFRPTNHPDITVAYYVPTSYNKDAKWESQGVKSHLSKLTRKLEKIGVDCDTERLADPALAYRVIVGDKKNDNKESAVRGIMSITRKDS